MPTHIEQPAPAQTSGPVGAVRAFIGDCGADRGEVFMLEAIPDDVPVFLHQVAGGGAAQGAGLHASVRAQGDGCARAEEGTDADRKGRAVWIFEHAPGNGDRGGQSKAQTAAGTGRFGCGAADLNGVGHQLGGNPGRRAHWAEPA